MTWRDEIQCAEVRTVCAVCTGQSCVCSVHGNRAVPAVLKEHQCVQETDLCVQRAGDRAVCACSAQGTELCVRDMQGTELCVQCAGHRTVHSY